MILPIPLASVPQQLCFIILAFLPPCTFSRQTWVLVLNCLPALVPSQNKLPFLPWAGLLCDPLLTIAPLRTHSAHLSACTLTTCSIGAQGRTCQTFEPPAAPCAVNATPISCAISCICVPSSPLCCGCSCNHLCMCSLMILCCECSCDQLAVHTSTEALCAVSAAATCCACIPLCSSAAQTFRGCQGFGPRCGTW